MCVCAGPARAADPERDSFEAAEDATAEVPAQVDDARDDLKEDLGSQGLLTVDDASGAVRFLAKLDGFLDSTPSDDPAGAARDYLTDQAEVFGVEPSDIGDLQRDRPAELRRRHPERGVHAVGGRGADRRLLARGAPRRGRPPAGDHRRAGARPDARDAPIPR